MRFRGICPINTKNKPIYFSENCKNNLKTISNPQNRKGTKLIKAAVCDDEKIIRDQILRMIGKQQEDCHIDCFASGKELLEAGKQYDVIFLDIQMEGMNGIETAKAIREQDRKVVLIFVTAVKEYVFDAFDVAAFHYLLKPIEEEKFAEVFHNAIWEIEEKATMQDGPTLLIQTKGRKLTLRQNDILFVENKGKKVEIHTKKDVIEAYYTMAKLEDQLADSFYRCHRGYLVNMAYIIEYGNDIIELSNGERVYMAKEKYPEFVKKYMRYLENGGTANV